MTFMIDKAIGALRQALTESLPSGRYPKVLYDALDKDFTPTPEDPAFAHISHDMAESRQMSMGGNPRFQADGFAFVTLYNATTSGDKDQLSYASRIADFLLNKTVTGSNFSIRFKSPTLANAPRAGAHWVRQVRTPFRVTYYPRTLP